MPYKIENGILVDCNECIVNIKKKIRDNKEFKINKFKKTDKESRRGFLECLISTLFYLNNGIDYPKSCREHITNSLAKHGQFSLKEINDIFNSNSFKSTNLSREFYEKHREFNKFIIKDEGKKIEEINYNFAFSSCGYKKLIGLCEMDFEIVKCPDCGRKVANNPENVTLGYEQDLVCPFCRPIIRDIFDTKGIIKFGRPRHHGFWRTQKPEFEFSGTDYFSIIHPKCPKSTRTDQKGVMAVNGLWFDDSGRIVLSLECIYCGARNALKPFIKDKDIPLLNASGAKWKKIESPILEIINKGESDKVEFKSSLRWDYDNNQLNTELEYIVVRSIAGFMNTFGGILLIGISNIGERLGLEKDYSTLGKGKKK